MWVAPRLNLWWRTGCWYKSQTEKHLKEQDVLQHRLSNSVWHFQTSPEICLWSTSYHSIITVDWTFLNHFSKSLQSIQSVFPQNVLSILGLGKIKQLVPFQKGGTLLGLVASSLAYHGRVPTRLRLADGSWGAKLCAMATCGCRGS